MKRDIIINLMQQLIGAQQRLLALLQQKRSMNEQTENGKKILDFCLRNLGKSFGNQYIDVGCAEEINSIANIALGKPIGGGTSTWLMGQALKDQARFKEITENKLLGGEVIIAVSGTGNGKLKNGHVTIYLTNNELGGNDSKDGKFKKQYTLKSFYNHYGIDGGFPIKYYRIL